MKKNYYILFIIISMPFCIYLSIFIHLMLTDTFNSINDIKIENIFKIILKDREYLKLYLLTQALLLIIVLINIKRNSIYKSELQKITDTIATPVKYGQGQFGTARWINIREFKNTFNENYIDFKKDIKEQKFKNGGLVVGYNKFKNKEHIYYVGDNTHSVVVGATRSGKTRTIVLQTIGNLGLAEESMIISDPKR